MKEFEKWFEKNRPYETYSCMDMAEKAWKAALKMVLKKENVVRFYWRAEYKSEEAIPTIYDDIREELEEE